MLSSGVKCVRIAAIEVFSINLKFFIYDYFLGETDMFRRLISKTMLLLFLLNLLPLMYDIKLVKMESLTIIVPDDYPTIQEAINAAAGGYTVYVRAGVYHENIVINKTLSLIGENMANTSISGGGLDNVIYINADHVSVKGFTILYANSGIKLDSASRCNLSCNRIYNTMNGVFLYYNATFNFISESIIESQGGILLETSSVNNNIIFGNEIYSTAAGIMLTESSHNVIVRNYITGSYFGVVAQLSSNNNVFVANNLYNNNVGIGVAESFNNEFYHNNLIGNSLHVDSYSSTNIWDAGYPNGGNYWSDYVGVDLCNGVFQNETGSDGIGDSAYIIDNYNKDRYPLMHAWAPFPVHNLNIGVGYQTIQDAINANETMNGHFIFVEKGVYHENIIVNKSINLVGENKENTIIDGDGVGTVVQIKANGAIFERFTIQNCGEYPYKGIHLNNVSNVTLKENIIQNCGFHAVVFDNSSYNNFINNHVSNSQRGVVLDNASFNSLLNNTIMNNSQCGIYLCSATSNSIENNTLSNNGHGIYLIENSSHNNIISNFVLNNTLWGIGLERASYTNILQNIVTHNKDGVHLVFSRDNKLLENAIMENWLGMRLESSGENMLRSNQIYNNTFNFGVDGHELLEFVNDIDSSNFVNGKPVYYFVNQSYTTIPSEVGYVALINCSNIVVYGLNITNAWNGLLLAFTNDSFIANNVISNSEMSINIYSSHRNTLIDNRLNNGNHGIFLQYSTNNAFRRNDINCTGWSLYITGNELQDFINDIDTSNKINGKPICYLVNKKDLIINPSVFPSVGYLGIVNSTNIEVTDFNLTTKNNEGVLLAYSSNVTITNNFIASSAIGIVAVNLTESLISNNEISGCLHGGISLSQSHNNTILNNYIHGPAQAITESKGINLVDSSGNVLRNNTLVVCAYGFSVWSYYFQGFLNDVDDSNTINGKPIYYWVNQQGNQVPADAAYVALVNCTNIVVQDLNLTGNDQGILLAWTNKCNVTNNILINNRVGIQAINSKENLIIDNYIKGNHQYNFGIDAWWFNENIIANNTIEENGLDGIHFVGSAGNLITKNILRNNDRYDILLSGSSENRIHHNSLISPNALSNAHVEFGGINYWDDGYPSGGNYWSGYTGVDEKRGPNQNFDGSDGIGDTPYVINDYNQDRYPWMTPSGPNASWIEWNHYHNYTEIVDLLLILNETYPDLVDVFSIGKSWQNQ
ncbi:MAG: hypothetical protein C0193_00250, partial [Candidatus Bathyarchaeota archaeon]